VSRVESSSTMSSGAGGNNVADMSSVSITQQAREEFDRPEYEAAKLASKPITIRSLSLKKDAASSSLCASTDPSNEDDALRVAPNFASAIMGQWISSKLGMGGPKPAAMRTDESQSVDSRDYVFQSVSAVLLPGEGTLLLGPSSSGKTTLMRTICDLMGGTIETGDESSASCVAGSMLVGGSLPSALGKNQKRRCAFVDQSDLTLTPILTVEETVRFARSCAEGDLEMMDESLQTIFELCGLDHVQKTVVGDADVRGISGGQKRRVKFLEMAVGIDATTFFLDEITNGLDAASALSICKVVGAALDVSRSTAITCLLQPSREVFLTFQRLILLTPGGELAYSGRIDKAVSHFEAFGLTMPLDGSMNEPEFLLRCASSPTDFWNDEEKGPVPHEVATPGALAKAFVTSDAGRALEEELDALENDEDGKASGSPQSPPANLSSFAQPMQKQLALLIGRGMTLVKRNPASTLRIVSAIIFGAFIGTLFLNTASDEKGTTIRAGYCLTLIFLSFLNSCMSPLDDLYRDRITFYTHRNASFYRTASYYIAQVICSLPVALLEALLLSLLSFFAVGMNRGDSGWKFFYFLAQFALLSWSGTAVSRVLAYSLPSNDMAQSLGPAALLLFVLSACYSPQYRELPAWLRWLAWISPCAYTYEGVMVSEGIGRNVGSVEGLVFLQGVLDLPRVPYTAAPAGLSTEGLVLAFDIYMLIILTLIFEILGCALLHQSIDWFGPTTKRYQVASGIMLSSPPWQSTSVTKAENSDEGGGEQERKSSIPLAPPAHLTIKDIVYEVDVSTVPDEAKGGEEAQRSAKGDIAQANENEFRGIPITTHEYGQANRGVAQEWVIRRQLGDDALSVHSSVSSSPAVSDVKPNGTSDFVLDPPEPGRLRLLSGITASFEPSTLTALMGSSGAGKSTLLDVIAGYKTGGHISGSINVNGVPKTDATWRSIAGYCEQVDAHNPAMTVRESLIFAARMRLRPFSIQDADKTVFAEEILSLLELQEFADMLVGDEASGEGLPKHARKRLTVGVELASNPSILFADEPTSGLDSLSAELVVSTLHRAAKRRGLTIVCTIHQPSLGVFRAFDELLLLRKGGVCVYNGPVADLDGYMTSAPNGHQYAMKEGDNPADHALSVFCGPAGAHQDWSELYESSDMAANAVRLFNSSPYESEIVVDSTPRGIASELYVLLQRQLLSNYRTPTYMAVRFWWTVAANLVVGLVYFQATSKDNSVTNVIGSIFFFVNIATVPLLSAVAPLIAERAVYYREISSGTYRRVLYGVSVQLAEIPFNLGFAIISFAIFYFMVGLKTDGGSVVYFLLMALAAYWLLPTIGQLFAFISPNIGAAVGIGSLILTLFTLTMGFLLPASEIPPWYIWLYWINPLRYILQGMVSNEIGGSQEGDEILAALTWSYEDRWWYCFVAIVLFGVLASVGTLAGTRISWLKR